MRLPSAHPWKPGYLVAPPARAAMRRHGGPAKRARRREAMCPSPHQGGTDPGCTLRPKTVADMASDCTAQRSHQIAECKYSKCGKELSDPILMREKFLADGRGNALRSWKHGSQPLADASARGVIKPEPLYTVPRAGEFLTSVGLGARRLPSHTRQPTCGRCAVNRRGAEMHARLPGARRLSAAFQSGMDNSGEGQPR